MDNNKFLGESGLNQLITNLHTIRGTVYTGDEQKPGKINIPVGVVYDEDSNTIGYYKNGEYTSLINLNKTTRAVPLLSSNEFDGGFVSASGEYSAGEAAWHAFDGTPNNVWGVTHGSELDWLKITFDNPTRLLKAVITNRTTYYAPSYDIQYSDNDVDWITTVAVTGTESGATTSCDISETGKHKYWRILLTEYASSGTGLAEVVLTKYEFD